MKTKNINCFLGGTTSAFLRAFGWFIDCEFSHGFERGFDQINACIRCQVGFISAFNYLNLGLQQ
jgi:hypothetical protein